MRPTIAVHARDLFVGDVLPEEETGIRWRLTRVEINLRCPGSKALTDQLVDVEAVSIGTPLKAERFSSYKPSTLVTIEGRP